MANYSNFLFNKPGYMILCSIETYSKTKGGEGQTWEKAADDIEKRVYNAQNYTNYITSIPFFNNFGYGAYCRARYGYTIAGYLPVEVVSVSPFKDTKKIARFQFVDIDRLRAGAGWRENYIINNARYFDLWMQDGAQYLKLITNEKDDKHAAIINLKNNRWVN